MAENESDSSVDCSVNFDTPTFNFAGKLTYLEKLTFTTLMAVVGATIVLGNSLVILAYKTSKKIRETHFNLYIMNLAIADFLIGILAPTVNILNTVSSIQQGLQTIIFYLQCLVGFFIFASASIQMVMSYDRYALVSDALKYRTLYSNRKARKFVIFIWLYSLVTSISSNAANQLLTTVSMSCFHFPVHNTVNVVLYVHNFIVPLTTIVTLNLVIFVKLKLRFNVYKLRTSVPTVSRNVDASIGRKQTGNAPNVDGTCANKNSCSKILKESTVLKLSSDQTVRGVKEQTGHPLSDETSFHVTQTNIQTVQDHKVDRFRGFNVRTNEISSFRMKKLKKAGRQLFLIVTTFVICWFPLPTLQLFFLPGSSLFINGESIISFTRVIILLNSAINPVIYITTCKMFRFQVKKIIVISIFLNRK